MKITLAKIVILFAAPLLFISCPKNEKSEVKDNNTKTVAIAKIISHPSLDAIEQGIVDELNDSGFKIKFDIQNANGDMNTASSIANKFKSEKADVVVGIATPMAVALANTIKDTPVVFTGVTDPIAAALVETLDNGYKNVTGLVDTIPIKEQLEIFYKLYPFKRLGLIYTNSETNAISMAKTVESVCKAMGIKFVSSTISNSSEVKQAAESMVGRVDAFYVTTDNSLVAGVASLYETAKANKIPVFSADVTSSLNGGAVYVLGFNYYQAGRLTGEMIIDILNGAKPSDMPIAVMTDPKYYDKMLDLDAAKRLNIEPPAEDIATSKYLYKDKKLINNSTTDAK